MPLSPTALSPVTPWIPAITPVSVDPGHLFSKRISSGCPATTVESCSSNAAGTCCFEAPGGLIVQPQFWDTDPVTGPANSWTIHGLWPDECDGSFQEDCDPSRDYTDISTLLDNAGLSSLVTFMNEFWVNDDGTNEELWEHEWATHGTCYSTLEPSCLPAGSTKGAEAVAFFQTATSLYQTLTTYDWLAAAGITPGSGTYTLSELQSAIKQSWGFTPAFDCDDGSVSEIYYYFYLEGSMIDGTFVPIDAPASEAGSCTSSEKIKYPVKSGATTTTPSSSTKKSTSTGKSTATTTRTSTSSTSTATGVAQSIPKSATISAVLSSGKTAGGLLSYGTWSTQTPGTYDLSGSPSSFTMTSSKGSCGVSGGVFSCGNGDSSTFSALVSGSNTVLGYDGASLFSADKTPSGTAQETVYTGSGHDETFQLVFVSK